MLNDLGVCEIVFERGVCERLWVRLCLREVYVGKIVFERCVCAHHAPPPLCSSCKHGAALGPLPWVLLPGSSSPGSSALGPSPWLLLPWVLLPGSSCPSLMLGQETVVCLASQTGKRQINKYLNNDNGNNDNSERCFMTSQRSFMTSLPVVCFLLL